MRSLSIKCVQTVRRWWQNQWDSYPHLPHRLRKSFSQYRLIPRRDELSPSFALIPSTDLSIAKIKQLPGEDEWLSTLSTPPITTTTTYINRREGASK